MGETATFTEDQLDAISAAAVPLFVKAVAQGLKHPLGSLNCDYWGEEYAEKLVDAVSGGVQ